MKSVTTTPLKPEFVMGRADGNQPKSVTQVGDLSLKFIEYVDGEGNKHAQVAMVSPSGNTVLLLKASIQGEPVATEAKSWLVEALRKAINEKNGVEQV